MRQDVTSFRNHIKVLIEESNGIRKYTRNLERRNKEIRRQMMDSRPPPDVYEYIHQRRQMYKLEAELKTWVKRMDLGKQQFINSKQKKRAALRELKGNNNSGGYVVRTQTR